MADTEIRVGPPCSGYVTTKETAEDVPRADFLPTHKMLAQFTNAWGFKTYSAVLPDKRTIIFETLTSGGLKPEGGVHTAWHATPQAAADALYLQLQEYLKGKTRVYWRQEPYISDSGDLFMKKQVFGDTLERVTLYAAVCRLYGE